MMVRTLIAAHSGCENTPDNSLASIRRGIETGADCVEIDLQMDATGKLWLSHDVPADYRGLVSLEEAFALVLEGNISVNCDLKAPENLLPALKAAERCGLAPDQLIFSGCVDPKLLESRPEIPGKCRIYLNSEVLAADLAGREIPTEEEQAEFLLKRADQALGRLHALSVRVLNAPYRHMPDELMAKLQQGGIRLSLWTVNREEDLRTFMGKAVYSITTRVPSLALRLREALMETQS